MPCYHPRTGYRSKKINPLTGKRPIVFKPQEAFLDMPVTISCGQCIGCRLEKSRQWAIRCSHEASLYDDNCFLTLTYNEENLPEGGNLNKKHFTLFIKRLRKKYPDKKIRYFMAGEYGEQCANCGQNKITCGRNKCRWKKTFGRPHYHAIIFNHDFKDKIATDQNNDQTYYISEELQTLWSDSKTKRTRGICYIGQVTFQSAAYVARYTTKKITGKKSKQHYKPVILEDGTETERIQEFAQMSKKPSIGKGWFDKYHLDIYRHDVMSVNCKNMRPPKYYDKEFEKLDPKRLRIIKHDRLANALKNDDNDFHRLLTKCELQHIRFRKLNRSYEND